VNHVEFLSAIRGWVAGAYRESPKATTVVIYAICILAAFLAHQYVKGISKKAEAQKATQTIEQKAIDSTCSNISAGGSVNVDCPQVKDSDDKKKTPPQH
jgi:hypothetical protein